MADKVFLFFQNLVEGGFASVVFNVSIILCLLNALAGLCLTLFKKELPKESRFSVYLPSVLCYIGVKDNRVYMAVCVLLLSYFLLFPSIILNKPVNTCKEKKIAKKEKIATVSPVEFVRTLERNQQKTVQSGSDPLDTGSEFLKDTEATEVIKQENNNAFSISKPNFTHVKSVIERLSYYPLNQNDKRQVKELENLINSPNSGKNFLEINEGLGALLKIMSKYGV